MWHINKNPEERNQRRNTNHLYKVMTVPTSLNESETKILSQKDYSSLTAAELVYLRSVKGCTRLDCFHNEDIGQELNVTPIIANIDSYSKHWENIY
jgi:hypothetical protein